jgi:hypothetical protein
MFWRRCSASGDMLAIYVVLHLGGSYSIMAEARKPVSRGRYALVRHPLYLTEQFAHLGALITYLSWPAVALFALQSFFQFMRARNEEQERARVAGLRELPAAHPYASAAYIYSPRDRSVSHPANGPEMKRIFLPIHQATG